VVMVVKLVADIAVVYAWQPESQGCDLCTGRLGGGYRCSVFKNLS
jgi:hypothetical protein